MKARNNLFNRADDVSRTRRRLLGLLAGGTSLAALTEGTAAAPLTIGREVATQRPVTAVFGLVRKEGMSHQEFVDYFQTQHIPLTRDALADEGIEVLAYRSIVPLSPDESPFDGIGELVFPSLEVFQQATETAGWERALADVPNFTQPEENTVIVGTQQDHLSSEAGQQEEGQQTFLAHLTAAAVPPSDKYSPYTTTNAIGAATCQLNTEGSRLDYAVLVANMEGVTGVHIHQGGPTENGPHLVELVNYTEPHDGLIVLQNTVTRGDECPTESGDSNCLTQGVTFDTLVENLRAGTAYVQVHAGPDGTDVIRGQLG